LARRGASDMGVTFYMALPGTELFRSLYDAGRIKIDRKYFRHILDGLAPFPSQTYGDSLGRIGLSYWKYRMAHRFYSAPSRKELSLLKSIRLAVTGLFRKGDLTRVQTVVRHGVTTGLETLFAYLRPRYMKRSQERRMFASWDAIYRRIHEQKLECGAVSLQLADTTQLHRKNVVPSLVKEHTTVRTIAAVEP